jgi:hypothetical protein
MNRESEAELFRDGLKRAGRLRAAGDVAGLLEQVVGLLTVIAAGQNIEKLVATLEELDGPTK